MVIDGISNHLVEMIPSPYAAIENKNKIEYDNIYNHRKSVAFKKLDNFGTKKSEIQRTLDRTVIEKFYTQE